MSAAKPFQYAVLRVVPRVERAEFINVGVVLVCHQLEFLDCKIELDKKLLAAMAPACDTEFIAKHLQGIAQIVRGVANAGPIAKLSIQERFHWITAPSSTLIQPSPAHTGLTSDPAAQLEKLFSQLVSRT